jgi:hypothetical protein
MYAGSSPVGLVYPDGSEITIGREIGNSISPVAAEGLSRRHAKIVCKDGKWTIEDLGSTNGTFVNGNKISSPSEIKPGDKVACGKFAFAVESQPAEAPSGDAEIKDMPPVEIPDMKPAEEKAAPAESAAAPDAKPADAPAAKPAAAPALTPVAKPVLKPGLKLPPGKGAIRPGLKLPPGKAAIRPGLKLPTPNGGLRPGLKLPPKGALKTPPQT